MKNFVYTLPGGGPFSRFFQCAVVPLSYIDFDNVYLKLAPFEEHTNNDWYVQDSVNHMRRHRHTMSEYGIDDPYGHILNYVLDQKTDHTYIDAGTLPIGDWYSRYRKIENSPRLEAYKKTLKKLKIKNHLYTAAENFCQTNNIGKHTLGVHARMTTMVIHTRNSDEVNVKWEDYYAAIDHELETGKYTNIFAASDNNESLELLDKRYPGLVKFYPDMLRFSGIFIKDQQDWSWDYNQFFMRPWWEESFIETMTLANCGGLVCRESNLSNMAVVFSDTIEKVTRVYDFSDVKDITRIKTQMTNNTVMPELINQTMQPIQIKGYIPGYGPNSRHTFTRQFPLKITISSDTVETDPDADFRILMQSEPPNLFIKFCQMVHDNHRNFDLVLSYDDRNLVLPNAKEFCPVGTWVSDDIQLDKKNQISFLMSSKINGEAYRMRFKIKKRLEKVTSLGPFELKWHRSPPIYPNKDDFFRHAKFNIACENQIMNNMYTEKLLDCFKTFTVPIYYGCANIEKYFNPKGIIRFNSIEEFDRIVESLHPDMYEEMRPYMEENYNLAKPYWEKTVYERIEDIVEKELELKRNNELLNTLVVMD